MNDAHDNEQLDKAMHQRALVHRHYCREIGQVEADFVGVEAAAASFMHSEMESENPYTQDPADLFDEKLRVLEIWFDQIVEGYREMSERIQKEHEG